MNDDLVRRLAREGGAAMTLRKEVATHLQRALCTYVEGKDTRATELTARELRDVADAILLLVVERCAGVDDRAVIEAAETSNASRGAATEEIAAPIRKGNT